MTPSIRFRALVPADLPELQAWIARPHVAEWWDEQNTLEELEAYYTPAMAGSPAHKAFIAMLDGEAIGFIQSYTPALFHHEGWWLDEHDPGVRGIDQFLANEHQLGKGLGTAMVRAFVARLFEDPAVTRVQTDPSPGNARAIRCYEKGGFRRVREMDTPDGPAVLMYCDRP